MQIQALKTKIVPATGDAKTISVALRVGDKWFEASVPFGLSTGEKEAKQIPLKQVLKNIKGIIQPAIIGKTFKSQTDFDTFLLKLDGTPDKAKLGANATLPLSIAFLRAMAFENKKHLWQYISYIAKTKPALPTPAVLLLEGGKHGKGKLSFQEFLLLPIGKTFKKKFNLAKQIERKLGKLLLKEGIMKTLKRGAEGALIPNISEENALLLIEKSIGKNKANLGIDVAATSFYKNNFYFLNKKLFSSKELSELYLSLLKSFPFIKFLEDPFAENDFVAWENFKKLLKGVGGNIYLIGDDLTTTNTRQIASAQKKGLCNGVIIKPNQIGSVTETIEAALLAKKYKWQVLVSHRARETEDDFIADLAVGIGANYIKAGGFGQKERLAKYTRLLAIEKEIIYNTNTNL
ncbi:phosphopyruvate hydratase [Candidatus Parcubacteria bacterium]|nr:phosphopyruvate hydratase [Candidatus Parcubacteria bacterium]